MGGGGFLKFADLGDPVPKKSYHHLGPSPMRANKLGPAQTMEPPGHKPLVVNGIVVGPFEEEEEGTGVVSHVVKVEMEGIP